ncbi:hypothetical protein KRP22_012170 [Phytophthora ramorum]|nr:Ankycorbin [Phytophthora ramorum]
MPSHADVVSLPAMDTAAQEFAFVSWDGSSGRRACPLATFGCREPQARNTRLVCAEPPRADQPQLKNAAEIRGAIALVVRGGCSFAHKARLLQRAGAVAMLLANNTREEPLAAFTMGESLEEIEENERSGAEPITMPCVMMCLRDVRELFQKFPPSVKTGVLSFEILPSDESAAVAEECLKAQRGLYEAADAGKGWKAIKRTTTSIMKMLELQGSISTDSGVVQAPTLTKNGETKEVMSVEDTDNAVARENQPPLLAFVQWATSASSYEICFAPLAEFCTARAGASYTGKLVACDPLLADGPLKNAEQLSGAVALLRRGSCPFPEKLERVQRAGAVAAIVCNDDEEDLDAAFVMSVDKIDAANATLPAVMISHNSFLRIQLALNCATARVLCLAGEAADGLLASSGKPVSFKTLPMPSPREPSKNDGNSDIAAVPDTVVGLQVACRDGDHAACQRALAGVESKEAKRKIVNASCPSTGATALHHACAAGNDSVVEFLLHLGAAPDAVDLALQTPLHIACTNGHVACARLLLRAEGSALQVPTVLYNVDEEYGGLSTRKHIGGGTAMHGAVRAGSSECVELLLAANARVDCTSVKNEQPSKYEFLGVSAKDLEGSTPLHVACESARAECALYLIAANADLDARDRSGRSPLLLACEAANDLAKEADAMQIIEKLISSGAEMKVSEDAESSECSVGDGSLLLDRVDSPELRREIEVLYLRQETCRAQQDSRSRRTENEAVAKRIQGLEDEVRSLRTLADEHDRYGHQLQQLQLQMQMILQFQTSYGASSSLASTKYSVATPLLAASLGDTAGKSEEELALDAALARDLGKKCLRQSQSVLAEKYFQRSLELMPLPGVHRLLDAARTKQTLEKAYGPLAESTLTASQNTNDLAFSPTSTRSIEIKRLRELVQVLSAAPQARVMLESELTKLEALSDGPEFEDACRWLAWLVALPWGDPSSGLQNEDLYTVKRSEFNQLDAIEVSRLESHRNQAARTIQRTFRERYALHLQTRAVAATRIQTIGRGKLARQCYKRTRRELLAARRLRAAQSANQQDGTEIVAPSQVNYATTIDPAIERKLQHRYHVAELVVGTCFQQNADDADERVDRKKLRVLQLVKCTEAGAAIPYKSMASKANSGFFVWTRWGADLDELCECSLSGPYEDEQDAQRRFDRITREEERREKIDEQGLPEFDTAYESGFDFLRSIVGVKGSRGFNGSVASA